jgi:cell division initiation protein
MSFSLETIRQRRFKMRFRGFDVREVDAFLEEVSIGFDKIQEENTQLKNKIKKVTQTCQEMKEQGDTLRETIIGTRKVVEHLNQNARKAAEVIIAEAEAKAGNLLNRTQNRLAQLHQDISELKRQRIQIEAQIRSVIDTHGKLLDSSRKEMTLMDETYQKVRFINHNK